MAFQNAETIDRAIAAVGIDKALAYSCVTPHTTQAGWIPPLVPALWALI